MSFMPPLFSVIIPTYNRSGKVMRAIQSVWNQTFQDYEIWVIDDGADNTEEILGSYQGRLHYRRGANAGVAAARNAGISWAQGKYVAFLDSDDWWYPHKLERIVRAMEAHPGIGLFYSQLEYVNGRGEKLWRPRIREVGGNGYFSLLEGNYVANSSAVVKKECLERVGGFDTKLPGCEDWDMWIRIARYYPIQIIPEALVAYEYLSEGSFSSKYLPWLKAQETVIAKALAENPELSLGLRRRIRSSLAYMKGRTCLGARDERMGLEEFKKSISLNPLNWRALFYYGLLRVPRLRQKLPRQIKRRLQLPEIYS